MYPKLVVDLGKVARNVRCVTGLCAGFGIGVCGVTKAFCGDERLARVYMENGVSALGDSRLSHIERYGDLPATRLLIRCPQVWEATEVVTTADASVNTELRTLEALDRACEAAGVGRHGVMLMSDLGDLREGIVDDGEFERAARFVANSRHLFLYGVGANLNCLSFVLPDESKMRELVRLADLAKAVAGCEDVAVSGGNSSSLALMLSGGFPEGVNSLRLGESLLFGRERAGYSYLPGTSNDAFKLQASVVEVKDKPSMPWGVLGADSYGRMREFEDKGTRRRALLAFGHQDMDTEVIWPVDGGVSMVGSSSDYAVVDVTDAKRSYEVGDLVEFRCGYHAVARAFASPYVEKEFVSGAGR